MTLQSSWHIKHELTRTCFYCKVLILPGEFIIFLWHIQVFGCFVWSIEFWDSDFGLCCLRIRENTPLREVARCLFEDDGSIQPKLQELTSLFQLWHPTALSCIQITEGISNYSVSVTASILILLDKMWAFAELRDGNSRFFFPFADCMFLETFKINFYSLRFQIWHLGSFFFTFKVWLFHLTYII